MGRISALTELTSLASDDYLVVLDSSANIAKKITVANAFGIPDLGFTAAGESWTYASASTITVPTDATTKYQRGNIIKITQTTGGTKYGVITTVAATLLTIEWLNGATLANEAITSPFYSSNATPLGAGGIAHEMLSTNSDWAWDSWTPTLTNATLGNGTIVAKYKQVGKTIHFMIRFVLGSTSTIGTNPLFSLPATIGTAFNVSLMPIGFGTIEDSGTISFIAMCTPQTSTTARFFTYSATATYGQEVTTTASIPMTWTTNDAFRISGTYETT